ncbi:GtrA family protein [Glaciibacter flavus]|uniref:GtrA family protein n=1 Tax=Orlajensenia flava TaxID=2565934 RepID=UPI003B00AF56
MTTTATQTRGWRALFIQVARFGAVGVVGLVVDITLFNILRATVFAPEHVHSGPLLAKIVSTTAAILVNWIGNRYWTFGNKRSTSTLREGIEFFAASAVGMLIGLGCLWISHYVLGFTSQLADNISGNVIGLVLGTAFRFFAYRLWVFAPHRSTPRPSRVLPSAPDNGLVGEG